MPQDAPARASVAVAHVASHAAMRRPLVLAACLIATFMAAVESTIVATAMPSIVADLGGFSLFSWVFASFLLFQSVTIPVYGRLADMLGRKKAFYLGASLFLVGSTLCGFAPSMGWLIFFRALQGIGAGGVHPISMTICGDIYTPAERAKVQGLISSVFGVAAVIGPSLGAFLVEHGAWQVVFWINIPVGVAAMAMISVFLREPKAHRSRRIDYAGSVMMTLAVGALLVVLDQWQALSQGALTALILLFAVGGAALLWHEARTPEPMMPLELWRDRVILIGSLGGGLAAAVMMGIAAFLPTYVQGPMGRTPTAAGLVLGVMSITWALASIVGGRLMVFTSYRFIASVGGAFLVAGSVILAMLTPERGPLWAGFGSLVIGLGMGCCNTAVIVAIQAAVPWDKRGAATSSCLFMRFVGSAIGAAAFGAMLNFTIERRAPGSWGAVDQLLEPALRDAMPGAERQHLADVVGAGLHNSYLLSVGLSLAVLLLLLRLPARLSPRNS